VKKTLIAAVAFLVLFLCSRFFAPPSYVNFPPRPGSPWVAFGDSLTLGVGSSDGHSYPALLEQRLGNRIVNLGSAGSTTEDGLQRVDDVIRLDTKVVLLCLGGNDGLRSMPAPQMFNNLGLIIDRLHKAGAFVVLIGVRSVSLLDKNQTGFKTLARQKRVLYVPDILSGVFANPQLMADEIHPNDQGYAVIAERIESALQPVVKNLLR
jgi:acyl-CoA thioesterase I